MGKLLERQTAMLVVAVVCALSGCEREKSAVDVVKVALSIPADVVRIGMSGCNVTPNPTAEQVFVFTDPGYRGACRVLVPGFYPDATSIGLDWIGSAKIGAAVRVKGFFGTKYSGNSVTLPGMAADGSRVNAIDLRAYGSNVFVLLGVHVNAIVSLRVEDALRPADCSDIGRGEVRLVGVNDCVIVTGTHDLSDDGAMGIQNDSLTAVTNFSGQTVALYNDAGFGNVCTASSQTFFTTADTGCGGIVSSVRFVP